MIDEIIIEFDINPIYQFVFDMICTLLYYF